MKQGTGSAQNLPRMQWQTNRLLGKNRALQPRQKDGAGG
jgi:hypothetical protein